MPDPFRGYVTVAHAPARGMVGLRADLSDPPVAAALAGLGLPMPQRRRIEGVAAWMSPDELLLFCEAGEGPGLAARLGAALAGLHHLAVDVSDMRAGFTLTGTAVREVLAKLTPADTGALPEGEMRRSRLGQVAAAFWLAAPDRAEVLVFRSVADYAFTLLCHAARPGSEVE